MGRIRTKDDILSKQDLREMIEGPIVPWAALRRFNRPLQEFVLRDPIRSGPADLDDQIDVLPQSTRFRVENCCRSPGKRWFVRDNLTKLERKWPRFPVSSERQLVPLLHPQRPAGDIRGDQLLVVPEQLSLVQIVEDTVVAERQTAESDHDRDELVQSILPVACREVDRGRHQDDRVVRMEELNPVPIDQADGRVRTEGGDGELFEEVPSDLKIRILLLLGLLRIRPRGYPFKRSTAGS